MDPVGITIPIITTPAPALSLPTPRSAPAAETPLPDPNAGHIDVDVQAADQQRRATIERMAQDLANVFIVSDKSFTIFKDATGQYITRYTSLRDGRVTYIPEPELFKLHGTAASTGSAVLIDA